MNFPKDRREKSRLSKMFKTCIALGLLNLAAHAEDPTATITLAKGVELKLGKDSMPNKRVDAGTVTEHVWKDSKVFPGTVRQYFVYTPAKLDVSKPAAVMGEISGQQ